MNHGLFWTYLIIAYFVGGIPFGVLWSKVFNRKDPRTAGSGSTGATNVWRTQGPWMAVLVYGCDMGKSALLVALSPRPWAYVIGSFCVMGHIFSPYLKFKGGKGIATASGVLMGIAPSIWFVCMLVWAGIVAATGYVSLGCLMLSLGYWGGLMIRNQPMEDIVGMGIIVACVFWAHRSNIGRLLNGTEYCFKKREKNTKHKK